MAAYRRMDDLRHPWADCLYTGISPTLGIEYEKAFTFTFTSALSSSAVDQTALQIQFRDSVYLM